MIELTSTYRGTLEVPEDPDAVYAVLADVPDSAAHFPSLQRLEEADGGYRWVLRPLGAGRLSAQLTWTCRYDVDAGRRVVSWAAVRGVGNSEVTGSWSIRRTGSGTRLVLRNELVFRLDVPRLFRRPAQPVFERENARVMAGYLANLEVTFRGGDGRVR